MALVPRVLVGLSVLAVATGCASTPESVAFENEVFYAYDQVSADKLREFERPYPPLDKPDMAPGYIGVEVLPWKVRLSRPKDWVIRSASNAPHKRFIEYVSPNQYIVAIYERLESTWDPWRVVMQRYEEDVKDSGGQLLSKGVPVATWNAQGRAYLVKRPVNAPKEPMMSRTREYLMRGKHRVVLLQIVYPSETLQPISVELLRVLDTFQVD